MIGLIEIIVYLGFFALSLYAWSCVRFDEICKVQKPVKVQLLLILLAMVTAYGASQFIFMLTIYH